MIAVQNLIRAASENQPLTLTNNQVREIALTVMGMDNMLAAYVEEYGRELADELTSDDIVEGEIIENDRDVTNTVDDRGTQEVVEERDMDDYDYGVVDETGEIVDEEETTLGLSGENDGLHSSEKE